MWNGTFFFFDNRDKRLQWCNDSLDVTQKTDAGLFSFYKWIPTRTNEMSMMIIVILESVFFFFPPQLLRLSSREEKFLIVSFNDSQVVALR